MCLTTHGALRNRFLEGFYVGDFFYPTSKIDDFRGKNHFFQKIKNVEKSKIKNFRESILTLAYGAPVPRGSGSSLIKISVTVFEKLQLEFLS